MGGNFFNATGNNVTLFRRVFFLALLVDFLINYKEYFKFWKNYNQDPDILYPIVHNTYEEHTSYYFNLIIKSATYRIIFLFVIIFNLLSIILNVLVVPNIILFITYYWILITSNDKTLLSDYKCFVLSFSFLFLLFNPSRSTNYNYQKFIFRLQLILIFFFLAFHKLSYDQFTTIPKLFSTFPSIQSLSRPSYWTKLFFFNSSSRVVFPLNQKTLTDIQPFDQRISRSISLKPNEFATPSTFSSSASNEFNISQVFSSVLSSPGTLVAVANVILPLILVICLLPLLLSCFRDSNRRGRNGFLLGLALFVIAPVYFGISLLFYNSFDHIRFIISLNIALYTLFVPLSHSTTTTSQSTPTTISTTTTTPQTQTPTKTKSKKSKSVKNPQQQQQQKVIVVKSSSSSHRELSWIKIIFVTLLLIVVVTLQIGIPLRSYYLAPQPSLLSHKPHLCWNNQLEFSAGSWDSHSCIQNNLVSRFYVSEHKLPEIGPGTKQILPHFIILQPIQLQTAFNDFHMLYETSKLVHNSVFMMTRQNFKKQKVTLDLWTSLNGRPYQRRVNSTLDIGLVNTLDAEEWKKEFELPLIMKYGEWKWRNEIERTVEKMRKRLLENGRRMEFYSFADFEGEKFGTIWKEPSSGKARIEVLEGRVEVFDMYGGQSKELKGGEGIDVGLNGWYLETLAGSGTSLWVLGFVPNK
eukprot:TRINITY_DN1751_c1_g1_i1.p1 TRINITY_DN1751_c1_g1~~TRINITY_DN1751_c1_g1_i1.p1  ORF type:complete len:693 (-),score=146.37 TRINITY_DN1751_c1_g1_i1:47-2125(-)